MALFQMLHEARIKLNQNHFAIVSRLAQDDSWFRLQMKLPVHRLTCNYFLGIKFPFANAMHLSRFRFSRSSAANRTTNFLIPPLSINYSPFVHAGTFYSPAASNGKYSALFSDHIWSCDVCRDVLFPLLALEYGFFCVLLPSDMAKT